MGMSKEERVTARTISTQKELLDDYSKRVATLELELANAKRAIPSPQNIPAWLEAAPADHGIHKIVTTCPHCQKATTYTLGIFKIRDIWQVMVKRWLDRRKI